MKKRTLKLAVLSLMMTAMLFNCKDKDKDPDAPDSGIIKDLDKVNIAPITVDAPAAVKATEAKVEASAKATEVNGALDGIAASGTVPASVSSAAADVSGAISASEVSTLNSVSSETVAAVAAGGALSPELKTLVDKAMANPALAAYLPKFTLPVVEGVTLKGTREAGAEGVEKVEGIQATDACIDAANAAFDVVKTRLDASKATEAAKVDAAYLTWIAPIAPAQTACTDGLTPKYAAFRTAAQQTAAAAIADLDAAQGVLGNLYPVLKALVNIQLLGVLSSINTLEAADKQACIAKATAAKSLADAAKTANLAKVNAAYTTALAEATKLKTAALASCHNQGGGN
ncbi:hypothetical protein [Dyadobacter sp. LHD-138]|uniref:hypothetical protein n=1 Tax=Dyadobacter sp. LHD-138 TaxID=3071413 RepID=UPI0027E0F05A|nr:hypothetical protein [Dyadobacter sp. LHD-138]MDQ6481573.1 hypothetical protein [Dyadobacter sp. LHD-138]